MPQSEESPLLDAITSLPDLQQRQVLTHLYRDFNARLSALEADQAIIRRGFNVLRWLLPMTGTLIGILIGKGIL